MHLFLQPLSQWVPLGREHLLVLSRYTELVSAHMRILWSTHHPVLKRYTVKALQESKHYIRSYYTCLHIRQVIFRQITSPLYQIPYKFVMLHIVLSINLVWRTNYYSNISLNHWVSSFSVIKITWKACQSRLLSLTPQFLFRSTVEPMHLNF